MHLMHSHYRNRRLTLFAALTVAALLALTGCGPRVGAPATVDAADELVVDMPTLEIEFDAEGAAAIAGIPVAQYGAVLGSDLSSVSMEAETVARLTGAGIQHIQIINQPQGLLLFVNSDALPALAWDEATLTTMVETLGALGTDLGSTGALLPLAPELGLGFVLKFPATGAAIPVRADSSVVRALSNVDLAAVRSATSTVNLELNYDADGNPTLLGLNPLMMGMVQGALQSAVLPADQLESIAERGIQSIGLKLLPDGISVSINENSMPYMLFDSEDKLFSMLDLVTTMQGDDSGALSSLEGPLQQLLPVLRRIGASLTVNFPS